MPQRGTKPARLEGIDPLAPFELSRYCSVDLAQERGRLGDSFRTCTVLPSPAFTVSNLDPNLSYLFVNGMRSDIQKLTENLKWVAEVVGQPVTGIINSQRSSFQHYSAALGGILSPRVGALLHRTAVQSLLEALTEGIEKGKTLRIVCHSQGTIITSNALELFRRTHSPEEWERLQGSIEIVAVGPAMHEWPRGIRVQLFTHTSDGIVHTTHRIFKLRAALHQIVGKKVNEVKAVELAPPTHSLAHSLLGYTSGFVNFLVARHRRADGEIDPNTLAAATLDSIRQGTYSDQLHDALIASRLRERDAVFARRLLAAGSAGQLGNYELPYRDSMVEIARA